MDVALASNCVLELFIGFFLHSVVYRMIPLRTRLLPRTVSEGGRRGFGVWTNCVEFDNQISNEQEELEIRHSHRQN